MMGPGGAEFLIFILYIAFAIFIICLLIRLFSTLYYVREACKKYLGIAPEKQSDTHENDASQDDAQQK